MICEHVPQTDIRKVIKSGLEPSKVWNGNHWQTIRIESTPVNLGGFRKWFICPECERRCAILYSAGNLACRKCHNLHYLIEHESVYDRAIRTAIRFRKRYGLTQGGAVAPFPKKPKNMQWHTYFKARKRDKELLHNVGSNF